MEQSAETAATAAEAAVATLIANGIETIYCLPGVQNDHLFDALHRHRDRIRAVHTRHEQGAAYMALGAAMATGKPAVFAVAPGPGVLNTTAALCTALACNAPVLCLTGQIPAAAIGRGLGMLHELPDQLATLRSLTKWADRITAPQEAVEKVEEAFRRMRSGRPGPVALECPIDVWPKTGPVRLPASAAVPAGRPLDPEAVRAAAALAGRAERPLIVVGSGAQDAAEEIRQLAERFQAPVVSHRMGRGVLDSRHPLSVTAPLGRRLWARADCVIAVGTRLMQQAEWGVDSDLEVIRIDTDPSEIDRFRPATVGILADAAEALAALLRELADGEAERPRRWSELPELRASIDREMEGLQPQLEYLAILRDELAGDAIVVDEMTQLGYAARIAFPVYGPRTFLSPGYQGTLGWGLATALGAKAAKPDVPVVSLTGDGGVMFNIQELATAVQHRIPIVVVLMNDGFFGNVRRIQEQSFGGRFIATELTNPDFVELARSFGAVGLRAEGFDAFREALRAGLAADQPTVIEVPVGQMPSPWELISGGPVRGGS